MSDNVIILGAGASVDAGIPVLANFVERMWEFAITGQHNGKPLADEDKSIFTEAIKVKNELDGYHGRAAFNDRNIEDIMSILSFNLIGRNKTDREKQEWFIKAIARTIELTCKVEHTGELDKLQDKGPGIYQSFWMKLFERFKNSPSSFPSIISFNYDLVLERSLFQTLISTHYDMYNHRFPFEGIKLKYHYNLAGDRNYKVNYPIYGRYTDRERYGINLSETNNDVQNSLEIELLKMHGSLNFPTKEDEIFTPTNIVSSPYILPPITNKWVGENEENIWSTGLERLREAKNIVIVGYSLPQTDIFMQYFLRAGVGPNVNLNKITVFNPTLYEQGDENDRMRERFGNCFSPQLRDRISFNPRYSDKNGYFSDFVEMINEPGIFFGHFNKDESMGF